MLPLVGVCNILNQLAFIVNVLWYILLEADKDILLSILNQSVLASSLLGVFSIQLPCIVMFPVYALG